ncbi:MAG: hypothetical protein HC796_08180 [Synechococcaceae cyanobacterium RL_1_2]|nr:hypothetical protein [Synechococcaceae cyanobacterium RL_1_2]
MVYAPLKDTLQISKLFNSRSLVPHRRITQGNGQSLVGRSLLQGKRILPFFRNKQS